MTIVVVGISGPSCSGKTAIASALAKTIPESQVVHQDLFFKDIHNVPCWRGSLPNWDCVDALEVSDLLAAVHTHLENTALQVVIVEGSMIPNLPQLCELLTVMIRLRADATVLADRRRAKVFDYPDPEDYFTECVLPQAAVTAKIVFSCPVLDLDSSCTDLHTLEEQALQFVHEHLR